MAAGLRKHNITSFVLSSKAYANISTPTHKQSCNETEGRGERWSAQAFASENLHTGNTCIHSGWMGGRRDGGRGQVGSIDLALL